ncbi:MAG: hypothetical protein HYS06_01000 [Methylocystis sp.]|nr:hypothetical protein [Methylocystis sp.]
MGADTSSAALAQETRLGPIRVRVDKDRLAAFCRETGFKERPDGVAPICFISVWLSSPDVHSAISRQFAAENKLPLHESQSFDCRLPLRSGESYDLVVALRHEEAPPRVVVNAEVSTLQGSLCLRAETLLRIVSRGGLGA